MKLFPLILCFLPLSLFAQVQVILNSGDTIEVNKANLEGDFYTLEKKDGRTSKISKSLVLTISSNVERLEFEQVFQVDSTITKDELFNRARSWFVDYYKDASEVLQVNDKESGELVGVAVYRYIPISGVGGVRINRIIDYRISVKIRNGKYKVRIYNLYNSKCFNVSFTGVTGTTYEGIGDITKNHKENNQWLNAERYDEMVMSIQVYVQELYKSLSATMSKPMEKDEDW